MGNYKKSLLCMSVAFACANSAAIANESEQEIEVLEVTGSKIKRADIEGVSLVVTISAADIKLQGHANVYDALSSMSFSSGVFVGEENS